MLAAPSMSSQGWVTEPADYIDRLFAYYTASNYHQTLYFKGQVHSMQKAIFECGTNMEALASKMQADLTAIYSRSFPESVRAEVTIDETRGAWEDQSQVNFFISLSVKHNGRTLDLQKIVSTTDSVFTNFQNATGIAK